jgi:DNA gyrase/topoisomerase IV subunit B
MDYDELWVTTMKPDAGGIVQMKANSMEELAKAFEIQMGNDPDKRKAFLNAFEISPDDIDN